MQLPIPPPTNVQYATKFLMVGVDIMYYIAAITITQYVYLGKCRVALHVSFAMNQLAKACIVVLVWQENTNHQERKPQLQVYLKIFALTQVNCNYLKSTSCTKQIHKCIKELFLPLSDSLIPRLNHCVLCHKLDEARPHRCQGFRLPQRQCIMRVQHQSIRLCPCIRTSI